MTKLTAEVLYTAHNKPVLSMGEMGHHSRMGNALHRWINDCTPGDTESVISNEPTLEYDIPEDHQVFITQVDFDMETASDDIHIEVVGCSAVAGGGTATAVSGHCHVFTGTAVDGSASKERPFNPPIRVRYADGHRSIAFRVTANDAAAIFSAGWHGWVESE